MHVLLASVVTSSQQPSPQQATFLLVLPVETTSVLRVDMCWELVLQC